MATWNRSINFPSDDARQAAGTVTLTDAAILLSAGTAWAGLRFTNCPIPKGALIVAATLTLNITGGGGSPAGTIIWGEAVDSADTFVASSNNISARTRTTASVTWSSTSLSNGDQNAPDITAILSEITSRAGWAIGNALALHLDAVSGTNLRFTAYDSSSALCARLAVTYTATAAAAGPLVNAPRLKSKLRGLV